MDLLLCSARYRRHLEEGVQDLLWIRTFLLLPQDDLHADTANIADHPEIQPDIPTVVFLAGYFLVRRCPTEELQRQIEAAVGPVLTSQPNPGRLEPALGEPRLDDAAKSKLRKQALDWLKAELSAWKRVSMTVEPGNKGLVAKTLSQWKQDADLAGIRDAKDLAKLPDEERAAFKKLWDAVEALMTKVQDGKTSAFQVGAAAIELACTSLKRQQRSDSD